ncbi:MAG: RluA family pseudouridine synthase, partial [Bacteroidales bacterium]|nr:RluA family pseudouridine synthase [Bacteroidales bacterium]
MAKNAKRTPHSQKNPLKFNVVEPAGLMDFLMKKLDGISRTKVKHILANKVVSVDGERTTQFDFALQPGMVVEIGKPTAKERFHNPKLEIVYEDKYLLVINKKEGLLTNSPTKEQETAQSILNQYFIATQQRCRAHTIHRLDRDTSGLMLFAKDKKVALMFEEDWKNTVYDRRYVAVVSGEMEERDGKVASWLKDNKAFVTYSSKTDNGGKYAETFYEVLISNRRYSLVELRLETGRKNQIRVHMQDIGHPVVGDPKYGNGDNSLGRLCLHAYKLCFRHPVKGTDLEFETPFPAVFEKPFP